MKILMIEDRVSLTDAVGEYFKREKYLFDAENDGEKGYQSALDNTYDVIILDIMLPSKDGWSILKDLRENDIKTPIIMLSALSQINDKVKGLNLGADDYLAKPFAMKELEARVKALSRRKEDIAPVKNALGDLVLNTDTHELTCKDNSIDLGMKEFEIMDLLLKGYPNQVDKEFIATKIWGYDSDTLYNSVEVYISFLRKKLKSLKSQVEIKSIRSLGYILTYENS